MGKLKVRYGKRDRENHKEGYKCREEVRQQQGNFL